MRLFWFFPVLGLCASSPLGVVLLPDNWSSHPEFDGPIRDVQNSQEVIDDLKAQLGLDVPNSVIEFPNPDLEQQILVALRTIRTQIDTLKILLNIPTGPSHEIIEKERIRLTQNGIRGNRVDIFTLYQISLVDLTNIQNILKTLSTLTNSMRTHNMRNVNEAVNGATTDDNLRTVMTNIIFTSPTENDFMNYVQLIEAGPCRLKMIGYDILFGKIKGPSMVPLTKKILELLLKIRSVITECNIPNHVIETYRTHIPRSLQILLLNDVSTVCIKNTKYNEELITDKYGFGGKRFVFTWTPKDRRDVSKWMVEYDSNMKMRLKNIVYGSYLNLENNKWNSRPFVGSQTSYDWEIELSSSSVDGVAIRHVGMAKYIFVNQQVFCPLRRHVQSSVMKQEAENGGIWEFIDCEDGPLEPEAV